MKEDSAEIIAGDGHAIRVRSWVPDGDPVAVVQILHGLAEHCARYERLAGDLVKAGYAVFTHDHRGHGAPAQAGEQLGCLVADAGWDQIVNDALRVNTRARKFAPQRPLYLLGHSMGSYLAQGCIARDLKCADRLILSAPNLSPRIELTVARAIAKFEFWRKGPQAHSSLLLAMSFTAFNKRFRPNRTEFDWLSRDTDQVDLYVADPLCGFPISNKMWLELLRGIRAVNSRQFFSTFPKKVPVLILGGERDAAGGRKGINRLQRAYRKAGLPQLEVFIYDDGRHEMFNETNCDDVIADLISWMKSHA